MTERTPERVVEPQLVRAGQEGVRRDGGVADYRPRKTLPVRVELGRQLRRRRTRITLGCVAVLPLLLLLAFQVGPDNGPGAPTLVDAATSSGLNFAAFALLASTSLLLGLMVALFFGDIVASEASWSSLKYLLAAPVPRARLLRQKAIVSAVLTLFGLALVSLVSLGVGVLWYGTGELVSPAGHATSFGPGVLRLAGAGAYLALHLCWMAGVALWLSVLVDTPLGAVGAAVAISIVSQILDGVTALGQLRDYLPTHYSQAWLGLLGAQPDWAAMACGAFSGLAYLTVFSVLAVWRFAQKDVTS